MRLKANHSRDEGLAALQRWRGSVMAVGIYLLLALAALNVAAQTSSLIPAPPGATGVVHPAPAPNSDPATQSNGATTPLPQAEQQPPADGQDSIFVFKKEVQEVMLHATVVD